MFNGYGPTVRSGVVMNDLSLYQASSRSILHVGSRGLVSFGSVYLKCQAPEPNEEELRQVWTWRQCYKESLSSSNRIPSSTEPITFIELYFRFQEQYFRFSHTTKIRLQNFPNVIRPPDILTSIISLSVLRYFIADHSGRTL
jgi:hypothetical protein